MQLAKLVIAKAIVLNISGRKFKPSDLRVMRESITLAVNFIKAVTHVHLRLNLI